MRATGSAKGLPFPLSQSLCVGCSKMKRVDSARGGVFLMCRRAGQDDRFNRYPLQPVISCVGYEESGGDSGGATSDGGGRSGRD
ncbi:hypothetical protein Pla86_42570 [Planctomycetes bacterium Pla86]|uniref:Uncharacterized protein n=1 Tax=Engelhardtia mirabilis TaxID=2528011 RepID=A0A518BQ89_9BACT|nr:hypothetical protein Pla133_42580 [Planctomycetes bacterium Pla133]QDV03469.1 hypothetical protein Pla86_42570 [Planctomycetes bacterium Pla86]